MLIERKWAMPNKNTFDIRPIRELIEEEMKKKSGTWIDPFANKNNIANIISFCNKNNTIFFALNQIIIFFFITFLIIFYSLNLFSAQLAP